MILTSFQKIIVMNTLAGIGMGLVGIFIPLYLLELNYSLSQVIFWILLHHTSLLIGAFVCVKTSNHIGLVHCWYIRLALVTILFTGLFYLPTYPLLLFFLAFFSGMESAFFWIPYNILMVRKTEHEKTGSSLALISNISSVVGIFIPGIAALLITQYSYGALFAVAFFFILISIFPVLSLRDEKTHFQFNLSIIKKIAKENKHFILSEIFDNLSQDAQIIWILFIFITGFTILDIGALGVITGVIGIFVAHITGSLIDKWHKKKMVRIGAIFATTMWLISYLVAVYMPTPALLYTVTALTGFAVGIFAFSYGTIMFNRARSHDAQFLVLREVPTILGRLLLFTIALICISIGKFELVFIFVAIFSLYFCFNNLDVLLHPHGSEN